MKKNILLLICLTIGGMALGQSYKIIVNKSNTITSLSSKQVSNIFLKKTKKYPNGNVAQPVDKKSKDTARRAFTTDVHKKTIANVLSYWQRSMFQGISAPPPEKSSDEEVIAFVEQNSGAIGYVSSEADITSVNVISLE